MEVTVKERLIQYLKNKGIGRNKFEKAAGISVGYISNLKSSPGADILVKILNAAPDLNRRWLLTGEGDMLIGSDVISMKPSALEEWTTTKSGTKYFKREGDGQLFMEVNVVPIVALGSPEDEFATLNENGDWDKALFEVDEVHHGHYYAFKVEGNSMDDGTRNSFEAGDMLLVRELPRDEWAPKLRINDWPFWVVCWDNNVRVKQIIAQDETTGDITLHSLNPSPEYTDFTLPLSCINRLFNVVKYRPQVKTFKI